MAQCDESLSLGKEGKSNEKARRKDGRLQSHKRYPSTVSTVHACPRTILETMLLGMTAGPVGQRNTSKNLEGPVLGNLRVSRKRPIDDRAVAIAPSEHSPHISTRPTVPGECV